MYAILAILATSHAATIKNCGTTTALFPIAALSLSPSNPIAGDNVTLHLEYSVPTGNMIEGGTTTYDVSYNFIPLSPTTEPLCRNIPCPLPPGSYSNDTTSLWPTGLSGSITTKMRWLDLSSRLLLCIEISGKV